MNLPNKLTMLRILLIPVFMVVLYWDFPGATWVAVAIFIVASFTDLLDGKIALCDAGTGIGLLNGSIAPAAAAGKLGKQPVAALHLLPDFPEHRRNGHRPGGFIGGTGCASGNPLPDRRFVDFMFHYHHLAQIYAAMGEKNPEFTWLLLPKLPI